jgi:hypothetical protein
VDTDVDADAVNIVLLLDDAAVVAPNAVNVVGGAKLKALVHFKTAHHNNETFINKVGADWNFII